MTAWTIGAALRVAALLLALAALLPPACAAHAEEGEPGLLWLPETATADAPLPLVIVLYDFPGVDPRGWRYAEQLTAAGIAVLHVELEDYSADGIAVASPQDDVASGLARLASAIGRAAEDPRFEASPIGLLSFGAAGQVALRAAADPRLGPQVAATAMLYPGCADIVLPKAGAAANGPVLLMHGDSDPANPPADCARLAAGIGRAGPVRHLLYAGAAFAWDLPPSGSAETLRLPWPGRPGQRVPVDFWAQAADFSAAQVTSFFAAAMPRPAVGEAKAP